MRVRGDMTGEEHGQLVTVYEVIFNEFKVTLEDQNTSSYDRYHILNEILVLIDLYKHIAFPYTSQSVEESVVSLTWYVSSCDCLVIPLIH